MATRVIAKALNRMMGSVRKGTGKSRSAQHLIDGSTRTGIGIFDVDDSDFAFCTPTTAQCKTDDNV